MRYPYKNRNIHNVNTSNTHNVITHKKIHTTTIKPAKVSRYVSFNQSAGKECILPLPNKTVDLLVSYLNIEQEPFVRYIPNNLPRYNNKNYQIPVFNILPCYLLTDNNLDIITYDSLKISQIDITCSLLQSILYICHPIFRALSWSHRQDFLTNFKSQLSIKISEIRYSNPWLNVADIERGISSDDEYAISMYLFITTVFQFNIILIDNYDTTIYYPHNILDKTRPFIILYQNHNGWISPVFLMKDDKIKISMFKLSENSWLNSFISNTATVGNTHLQEHLLTKPKMSASVVAKISGGEKKRIKSVISEKQYKKMKLLELQTLCIKRGISTTKPGIKKPKKRTKSDLIIDLIK